MHRSKKNTKFRNVKTKKKKNYNNFSQKSIERFYKFNKWFTIVEIEFQI